MEIRKLYINGEWVDSVHDEWIEIENPATHEIIAKVPRGNKEDVDKAVKAARAAFETWQYTPLEERVALMKKVVEGLESRRQELIETITKELGSPYKVSAEVHTDPFILEAKHYIQTASEFPYEQRRLTSVVRREPAGVFNLVTGRGGEVGNALATHEDVDMISFTGSTGAGREVARMALGNIKKIALELGGKSAAILLDGGDWENGIHGVLETVVPNAGQTCNALTRLLVPKNGLAKAEEIIKKQLEEYQYGPAEDPAVTQGPLSSKKQFDRVKGYIELGLQEGARMVSGEVPEDNGSYYIKPVIFSDVKPDMRIAQEEIFGPVLVVIPYETEEEAVKIANDSIYGLAGAVYGPEEEANKVARQMKTGTVYVNEGQWDPTSPFGGYKQSGLGREGGVEGYEEFLEIKTIYDK